MPRFIIHHDGYFLEWSTVVDAPVSYGMRREEFEEYYLAEHGRSGMLELAARLERAERNGTSAIPFTSVESLTSLNRAGPRTECIPFSEIFRIYCRERPTGGPDEGK